ncbi:hypothetical protein BDV28DRAFT_81746 [Aspergillus coremiiformis]|uniref:RING-type domain-containing protein n=1 Tax=Aspergillus coremiiformis TaxID=138285 RepID=A0A5N6YT32_9EURO|nr:hypothetical protein BDV28DRAFT_81746 [Aspergillus coremiiformis]
MDGGPMEFGYPWTDSINDVVPFDDDDELLLGEIHHMHWGLDGQNDDLSYQWNEPHLPFARPAKKMRSHNSNVDTTGLINEYLPLGLDDIPTPSRHTTNPAQTGLDNPTPRATAKAQLLPQILEIFPDISHQYVEELITRHKKTMSDGAGGAGYFAFEPLLAKETILEEILENPSYPKQEKLKRKTEEADESDSHWKIPRALHGTPEYRQNACDILAQEFLDVPIPTIRHHLAGKKGLYSTYLSLLAQENLHPGPPQPRLRLKRPRPLVQARRAWDHDLISELDAARRRAEKDAAAYREQKEEEAADKLNEEEHSRSGNLVECQCCFSDVPSNRMVPCEGADVHFFCFTCIRKTAETQIGLMKYKLQCLDTSECKATFAHWRLKEALGPSLMAKLDHLQQQDEIEQAGLEGLENCPFCDFRAICPSVKEDREFRCYNPSCETVSCRLCKDKSHIPMTCDEARKEKGLPARHTVEEAMSEALIRNCPKCNIKIIKETGCNKMTCSKCQCVMCYLCKKDISREHYNHFGRPPTYCETHDDRKPKRFEDEIEQAQKMAIEQILSKDPNLTEEELRVDPGKKNTNASTQTPRNPLVHFPQPQAPLLAVVNGHRLQPARRTQRHLPTLGILPQPGHQRFPPILGALPYPPIGPIIDVPDLPFTGPQRGLDFNAVPAFEPHSNLPPATLMPNGSLIGPPEDFDGFLRAPPKDLLLDAFTFIENTDNVAGADNPQSQTRIPALGNYETGTMPDQRANMPLWLDGPLYNF